MKATIVVDNNKSDEIPGEWGLCVYIEYGEKKLLLDTGASQLFAENADELGISLRDVDIAVLSHAHYDHANGMAKFFEINPKAKFYLRDGCAENCYHRKWLLSRYIGLPKGILKAYQDRIVCVSGSQSVCEGVDLIPHTTLGLSAIGRRENMYQRKSGKWVPDDFSHEQSLVLETARGLAVFNSCSHGGAVNIIHEVEAAYPGKRVSALIGGFHLFNKPDHEVRELARKIKGTGIGAVYTGHCTGEKAYHILKDELGDALHQFRVGLTIEL